MSIWGDFGDIGEKVSLEEKTPEEIAAEEAAAEEERAAQEAADKEELGDDPENLEGDPEKQEDPEKVEKSEVPEEDPSKKDPETSEEEDELVSTFDSVSTALEDDELLFLDPEKEYEGTSEGFAEMMKDNMAGMQKKHEDAMKEREAQIRKEYEKEKPSVNDLDTENEKHATAMLNEYYQKTGMEPDEIKDRLAELKDMDFITKEAKVAQRFLAKEEKKEADAKAKADADAIAEEQRKTDDYIAGVKTSIDELEEIADFKLTKKMRSDFKDYLFKEDASGMTAARKAAKDPERRLRLAFMDFVDYNKKDFEIKAKTAVTKEFKKKTSRFTSKKSSTKGSPITPQEEEVQEFNGGLLSGSMW